ncbi:MAG: tetratricopeptide repeat protein [Acidobacteria bacterium]|nr:tetratricopeptide repeat protein [Acidobacteriota bacterium]
MRRAEVARLSSRAAAEVEWLKRALRDCNESAAPLTALLRAHGRRPLPGNEAQEYRKALIATFDDPSSAPPPGVLEHIARGDEADESVLRAAFGLVEKQLALGGGDLSRFLRLKALLEQRLGRRREAAETLAELRSLEPRNEEIAWALLRLFTILSNWDDAADLLGEMVEGGARGLRSRYAQALARAGRVDEANEQLLLVAAELDRGDQLGLNDFAAEVLAAAWNLRDAGRFEEAEGLFRLAHEHAPPEERVGREAALALVHLYGSAEERAAHRQAVTDAWLQVTDPQLLLNEGANQLSAGNYDRAIALLKRAAEELGHLEAVWYNLGFAAYRAERWDEAAQALDRASELNDQRADTFFFSGLALTRLERWEEAIPRLLRTLELDPERRLAHYQLWVGFRLLGREDEAARHQAAYDALGDE